jgi:5'-methylthioadenosine phosphorylase
VNQARVGIIGGSGLYEMEGIEVKDTISVDTPFGQPSAAYTLCEVEGREALFLPRHGKGHSLLPGEINFRANIYGFKKLCAKRIIGVSAVGSMQEKIAPRDVVLPDQFIDRTHDRHDTFFGNGVVAHISFADPVCEDLRAVLLNAAKDQAKTAVHDGGTYLCMEGPAFSTRAESRLYRTWDVSVIGMTNIQEAKLAREAELCYATLSLVTDYDCWHEGEEEVSVEMLMDNLKANAATSQQILRHAIPALPEEQTCPCASALENSILTPPEQIPQETRDRLDIIMGKYLQ